MNSVKIRHKKLATMGLTEPIKFTVIPKVDVLFDTNGIGEVSERIVEQLLKSNVYELVKSEPAEDPRPPISVEKPVEIEKRKPGRPSQKEKEKVGLVVESEPVVEVEPKVADFIKQL